MTRALLIVDVQNDFTEGGALAVAGGDDVARGISDYVAAHADSYIAIVASRDWHNAVGDNGGHFALDEPDFRDTWPVHCVAGTSGAAYDPLLATSAITHHVYKGQGVPAYSLFEGATDDGVTTHDVLRECGATYVDVVGIATDHCVRASASDALKNGFGVRILTDLIAGVDPAASEAALADLARAGADLRPSTSAPSV